MSVDIYGFGGTQEIGGNKFLVWDREQDVRVLLDFGTSFSRYGRFFNEYLSPRTARGLLDAVELGLIPPIPALYRPDLAPEGYWERRNDTFPLPEEQPVHAVLLSHGHRDHFGDMAYLRGDIPIYSTAVTEAIIAVMQATGQSRFDMQWRVYKERYWENGLSKAPSSKKVREQPRPWVYLDDGETFSGSIPGDRGTIPVRWWPVDHSVPGAAAFALKTSAGWIGYTGDLRFHGKLAATSRALQEAWAQLSLTALLCEGTRLDSYGHPKTALTEDEVQERAFGWVKRAQGRLVVADFAPRNVERLERFWTIARETGRRLVLLPKDVALLEALAPLDATYARILADAHHTALYDDPKVSLGKWEEDLRKRWLQAGRLVTPQDVAQDPGAYLLCFSLWDVNDLLDIPQEAREGGYYLYSNSRAYDEEQMVDLQRLRNWITHLGLTLIGDPDGPSEHLLHVSGHAYPDDLVAFVQAVRPRYLVPIHTEHAHVWREALKGTGIDVLDWPGEGRPLRLS